MRDDTPMSALSGVRAHVLVLNGAIQLARLFDRAARRRVNPLGVRVSS